MTWGRALLNRPRRSHCSLRANAHLNEVGAAGELELERAKVALLKTKFGAGIDQVSRKDAPSSD